MFSFGHMTSLLTPSSPSTMLPPPPHLPWKKEGDKGIKNKRPKNLKRLWRGQEPKPKKNKKQINQQNCTTNNDKIKIVKKKEYVYHF